MDKTQGSDNYDFTIMVYMCYEFDNLSPYLCQNISILLYNIMHEDLVSLKYVQTI